MYKYWRIVFFSWHEQRSFPLTLRFSCKLMVWLRINWKSMELKSFRSYRNTLSGSFLVWEPVSSFCSPHDYVCFYGHWFLFYIVSVAEEQTDNGGDGWIDTTRGRARIDYNDEEDTESSTYFHNEAPQGQKRKKAPFFKYSKKRKAYGNNTSYNSKGSVAESFVLTSCLIFSYKLQSTADTLLLFSPLVAAAAISRGHRPTPEVDQRLQAVGPEAPQVMHQRAGGRASWLPLLLKPTSGLS